MDDELRELLEEVAEELYNKQCSLDPEAEKLLYENSQDLYIE